jgi:prepilin-type N-terminal cleavage/methylation domain-containing protein
MRKAGFTLAETVVAMSLFALAATVLCQAALNARLGLQRLDEHGSPQFKLDWIRDDILAIANRKTLEEGGEMVFPQHVRKKPREGDEEAGLAGETITARWEAEIFPTPVLDVHQLNITVELEQGEEMAEPLTGSYYVYRPGWYEDADGRDSLQTEKQDEWERRKLNRGI